MYKINLLNIFFTEFLTNTKVEDINFIIFNNLVELTGKLLVELKREYNNIINSYVPNSEINNLINIHYANLKIVSNNLDSKLLKKKNFKYKQIKNYDKYETNKLFNKLKACFIEIELNNNDYVSIINKIIEKNGNSKDIVLLNKMINYTILDKFLEILYNIECIIDSNNIEDLSIVNAFSEIKDNENMTQLMEYYSIYHKMNYFIRELKEIGFLLYENFLYSKIRSRNISKNSTKSINNTPIKNNISNISNNNINNLLQKLTKEQATYGNSLNNRLIENDIMFSKKNFELCSLDNRMQITSLNNCDSIHFNSKIYDKESIKNSFINVLNKLGKTSNNTYYSKYENFDDIVEENTMDNTWTNTALQEEKVVSKNYEIDGDVNTKYCYRCNIF